MGSNSLHTSSSQMALYYLNLGVIRERILMYAKFIDVLYYIWNFMSDLHIVLQNALPTAANVTITAVYNTNILMSICC